MVVSTVLDISSVKKKEKEQVLDISSAPDSPSISSAPESSQDFICQMSIPGTPVIRTEQTVFFPGHKVVLPILQ